MSLCTLNGLVARHTWFPFDWHSFCFCFTLQVHTGSIRSATLSRIYRSCAKFDQFSFIEFGFLPRVSMRRPLRRLIRRLRRGPGVCACWEVAKNSKLMDKNYSNVTVLGVLCWRCALPMFWKHCQSTTWTTSLPITDDHTNVRAVKSSIFRFLEFRNTHE